MRLVTRLVAPIAHVLIAACLISGPGTVRAAVPASDLQLARSVISLDADSDGRAAPQTRFHLKDPINVFTEVTWRGGSEGGQHHLLYKWFTGDQLSFQFDGTRDLGNSPSSWPAWISGTHLGVGHHRLELYVDERLLDTREFDIVADVQPSPSEDEQKLWDDIRNEGRGFLVEGNIAGFVERADEYRRTAARTPAGLWKISQFYKSAESLGFKGPLDTAWSTLEKTISDWLKQNPASSSAVVIDAKVLIQHAWAFRGQGYSNEVTPEGHAAYEELIGRAEEVLDAHRDAESADPEWSALRIEVAMHQGMGAEHILDLASTALERAPTYYRIHYAAINALAPKWGGSYDLQHRYVDLAVRKSSALEGTQAYARVYFSMARNAQDPVDDLNLSGAKWPPMQKSFDEILAAWPSEFNRESYRAMACKGNAPAIYRSLGRRPAAPAASVAWWDTDDFRKNCDAIAFENKRDYDFSPQTLRNYFTYLKGFGEGWWQLISIGAFLLWLATESLISLRRRHRHYRLPSAPVSPSSRPRFRPAAYPRTYRYHRPVPIIGNRNAIRMFVFGIAIAAFSLPIAIRDFLTVIPLIAFGVVLALMGALLTLYTRGLRIVLQADRVELPGRPAGRRSIERSRIGSCALFCDEGKLYGIHINIQDDALRLQTNWIAGVDQDFVDWFSSLPHIEIRSRPDDRSTPTSPR